MFGRNKLTTTGGVVALIGAIGTVFTSISSGEMPDMEQISVILAAVGGAVTGLFAKDHNVTGIS